MKNMKLFIARRENHMKQEDVARKIGIHPTTYYRKESGKLDFTLTECRMLAKLFGCTLNDLFGGDNDEQPTHISQPL